jgi:membrane protein YqaA with SNARE-associated domain
VKAALAWIAAWGPLGILGLAILDSAGIPIPGGVDVLLVTVSASGAARAYLAAALAVAGSLAGNLILFFLSRKGGEAYLHRHCLSPRAQRFQRWFLHYGLLTVFIPGLLPIPLPMKVFVISAGALGVGKRPFVLTVLAARAPRYFGLAYLGTQVGANSFTWFREHALELTLVGIALFLFLLALVKFKDRVRARAAREARPELNQP